ncbi:hypothetical protein [Agrobacterium tumefaciens]|uniref:hypothetical protein n=1 Tax=Agrobacterium tumefaciens TaxID=358 RepID=UPI001573BF49|nr:hypothetical protein [Agrobacterium tumefaciens]NTE34872.1 hypothetical protein [Agrobacterium tumefaciens]NTE50382.1 hypothetical protein [Agrobacterium tumefaciens]
MILALAKNGPTPWTGKPAAEAKLEASPKQKFESANWAILFTSRKAQLFKRMSLRNGVMTLKSTSEDGTPLLRGPQYQMSARDLRGPEWRLYASYADAANDLVEYF